MSNHLGDTNKMVDTPRTNNQIGYDGSTMSAIRIDFCRKLERELNAAYERINRLEEAGDAVESDKQALKKILADMGAVGSMGLGSTVKWAQSQGGKAVSDTPRMDASAHDDGAIWQTGCDIERELNAANDRIKRLEAELEQTKQDRNAIAKNTREPLLLQLDHAAERIKRLEDRIHRASTAFFRDGSDGHVASQMLQILEEERGKK